MFGDWIATILSEKAILPVYMKTFLHDPGPGTFYASG